MNYIFMYSYTDSYQSCFMLPVGQTRWTWR